MKVTVSDELKKTMEKRKGKEMEKWEKDLEQKNSLEDIFHDTQHRCGTDPELRKSVEFSKETQVIIPGGEFPEFLNVPKKNTRIIVAREKTLEAARIYAGRRIAVLNFASPFSPGGIGTVRGLTQEECLCRESTLYECISSTACMEGFYDKHKNLDCYYNADMIYTPEVTVFKTHDRMPEDMLRKEWFKVDIITMAAPNVSSLKKDMDENMTEELIRIFEDRFARVLYQAYRHGVEHVILGAFGCGAFKNDPMIVATGAARAIEEYGYVFDTVHFAIYEPKGKKLFHTFRMVLDRYLDKSQTGE